LLARVVNDDTGNLTPRSGPGTFASKLAPTEKRPRLWIHKKKKRRSLGFCVFVFSGVSVNQNSGVYFTLNITLRGSP
jgi:hypothetical protein